MESLHSDIARKVRTPSSSMKADCPALPRSSGRHNADKRPFPSPSKIVGKAAHVFIGDVKSYPHGLRCGYSRLYIEYILCSLNLY